MDILEIYKRKIRSLKFPHFEPLGLQRSLDWYCIGFSALRDGKVNLIVALRNLLPGRFKGKSNGETLYNYVLWKISTILSEEKGESKLFGQNFSPSKPDSVSSWYDTFLLIEQILLRDQYHARSFIKKDSVIIDAGANIGLFSIFCSRLAPESKIYSFEPTPSTFKVLKRNCEPYKNIIPFQNGLGDEEATKNILESDCDGANNIEDSGRIVDFNGAKSKVHIRTIDSYEFPKIDFIKMDVEGYERQVLKGAKETIKKYSPVISVSAYHKPDDLVEIPKIVKSIDQDYKYKVCYDMEMDLLFWK